MEKKMGHRFCRGCWFSRLGALQDNRSIKALSYDQDGFPLINDVNNQYIEAENKIKRLLLIRIKHQFRSDFLIKLFGSQKTKRNGSLFQRSPLLVSFLRALRNVYKYSKG